MISKINNVKGLLIEECKDLYHSNQQELKELPKFEKTASSPDLKRFIKKQMIATKFQQKQLDEVLTELNWVNTTGTCDTTTSILNRTEEIMKQSTKRVVRDASIVNSLQYLNHRKIAGFVASANFANQIGQTEVAEIFQGALEQERDTDFELCVLAEKEIDETSPYTTY